METYKIKITFKSDALPGSGEGFGALINSDIVFDDVGIPIIPAKRIKGCLRESANEICYWMDISGMKKISIPLEKEDDEDEVQYKVVKDLFGRPGQGDSSPLLFSDLSIPDYNDYKSALVYFKSEFPSIISKESIVKTFTYLRQQTAIDENTGVAKKGSLRTSRILKKGISFEGDVVVCNEERYDSKIIEQLLYFSCLNLWHIGTMRTRGFGEVECRLFRNVNEISFNLNREE